MKKIEILAPAGSYDSLVAAVQSGCDAVYIGGSKFGARAFAANLTEEELLQGIDYVHLHNKKIYLTVNTLLKEGEMDQLYDYILPYYKQGIDAVIVQDFGVLNYIHEHFEDLPIHGSTQMTLTMAGGIDVLKQMGVTRVVTPRELSLDEIRKIGDESELEIESFVHGALCYCYSGQCLMSSMIGGRSGNRGRCAQPCRLPYQVLKDGKAVNKKNESYVLSPKDICTLDRIPALVKAGIHSFKIEGRMKKPEYVAMVVSRYRKYVDLYEELGEDNYNRYIEQNREELERDMKMLLEIYNRGSFSSGYYYEHNGKDMMADNRPNHNGVAVGKVTGVKGNHAVIKLNEDVNPQDLLEIRGENDNSYEFTLKDGAGKGSTIGTNFYSKIRIVSGQSVYRMKNKKLISELLEKYMETKKREEVHGIFVGKQGEPIKLELCCNGVTVEVFGEVAESAMKQPLTEEKIWKQLNKTNETEFYFKQLEIQIVGDIFVPVVKLNELRRNGFERLYQKIVNQYRRKVIISPTVMLEEDRSIKDNQIHSQCIDNPIFEAESVELNRKGKSDITVSLLNTDNLETVLEFSEIDTIYLDMGETSFVQLEEAAERIRLAGKRLFVALPQIFRDRAFEIFKKNSGYLNSSKIDGYLIRSIQEYSFLMDNLQRDEGDYELRLDYNVYTINGESKKFWEKQGVYHFTVSPELNYSEIRELGCQDSDLLVYGYLPVMVSAQCTKKNTSGCNKKEEKLVLRDRLKKEFIVINNCRFCYNTVYNGQPFSLLGQGKEVAELSPKNMRISITFEDKKQTRRILQALVERFYYGKKPTDEFVGFTKGHFNRGIE